MEEMKTLTKTQAEIVQMVSDGLTAEEIATLRFRSIRTIQAHVEQARLRLGARNIAQLVKIALQQGLINFVLLAVVIGSACSDHGFRRARSPRSVSIASLRIARSEV
jgi:DNA-binding CsgD family transcriptional regulator